MPKIGPKTFDNPALEILWRAKTLTGSITEYRKQKRQVLLAFHELCGGDFCYRGFAPIAQHTTLEVKRVRVLTRALAKNGLLEYQSGLFYENGDVAGAGYTITSKGRAVAQIIEGDKS